MSSLPSTDDLLRVMTILGIPGDPLYIMKDHTDDRRRAELLAHIQNTNSQYNLPEIGKKLAYKANRANKEQAERQIAQLKSDSMQRIDNLRQQAVVNFNRIGDMRAFFIHVSAVRAPS